MPDARYRAMRILRILVKTSQFSNDQPRCKIREANPPLENHLTGDRMRKSHHPLEKQKKILAVTDHDEDFKS